MKKAILGVCVAVTVLLTGCTPFQKPAGDDREYRGGRYEQWPVGATGVLKDVVLDQDGKEVSLATKVGAGASMVGASAGIASVAGAGAGGNMLIGAALALVDMAVNSTATQAFLYAEIAQDDGISKRYQIQPMSWKYSVEIYCIELGDRVKFLEDGPHGPQIWPENDQNLQGMLMVNCMFQPSKKRTTDVAENASNTGAATN